MGESTLEIAGQPVARAKDGALEAEYALFDPGDIELRATEPGIVREVGYQTTVAKARARLDYLGLTESVVRSAFDALAPIAVRYARGPLVRRVLGLLGPAELFEGGELEVSNGHYAGRWLDVAALARDIGTPGTAVALQALHLAALLHDAADDALVMLDTESLTKLRRPGERTHKRIDLELIGETVGALRALGEQSAPGGDGPETQTGPARLELFAEIRKRRAWSTRGDAPARLARIERAISAREQPTKGPLANKALWALERSMSDGEVSGVLDKLDALERERGRSPVTTYLRERASLMLGKEDPRAIATRVSALALSMSSFLELELLAAEAWLAAGEPKRATPYARDLVENTGVDPELRTRAEAILADVTKRLGGVPAEPSGPRISAPPSTIVTNAAPEPPSTPSESGPFVQDDEHGAEGSDDQAPITALSPEPEHAPPPTRKNTARSVEPEISSPGAAAPPSNRKAPVERAPSSSGRYMAGASVPPLGNSEQSTSTEAGAPARPDVWEPAEMLSLPPGASGEISSGDENPRSVAEARALFTRLSRELGREYRVKRGVELRTDARSIEAMQARLFDLYYSSKVRTAEDWLDVRRHGAFLSEILARTLGAVWTDIGPSDLGYWVMTIAPGIRVLPFGRVLRYVSMGPRERDLVSYYFELRTRQENA